jgi:predicted transcriptional regulator
MSTIAKTLLPPKPRKTRKKLVSIRLDPEIQEQVDELAKADKRSFSQFVELVLEKYVQEQRIKAQEMLKMQQELTHYFPPSEKHGIWSVYDEFKAAEQLQTLLNKTHK